MGTHAPQQQLTAISSDGGRGLGLTESIACFPSSQAQEAQAHCQLPFPDKFTEAAAYVAQRERSASCRRRHPPAADPPAASPPAARAPAHAMLQMATHCRRRASCCCTRCINKPQWWVAATAPTFACCAA